MRILEAFQPAKWVDLGSLCRMYHAQDAAIMNDSLGKCVGCPLTFLLRSCNCDAVGFWNSVHWLPENDIE